MKVVVVIPTISGREDHLERCREAYARTAPQAEQLVIVDRANWPTACNLGTKIALGMGADVVHYTADDLVPHDGWFEAATEALRIGVVPAPYLFQPDGARWESELSEGDGFVSFSRIPTLTMRWATRVGEWPDLDYLADVWLGAKLDRIGVQCTKTQGYTFTHTWAQHGRLDSVERMEAAQAGYEQALREL